MSDSPAALRPHMERALLRLRDVHGDMSRYCMHQRRTNQGSARSTHPVFPRLLAVARNLGHNHSIGAVCALPGQIIRLRHASQ